MCDDCEKTGPEKERRDFWVGMIGIALFLIWLVFVGGGVYIALHFIGKYW